MNGSVECPKCRTKQGIDIEKIKEIDSNFITIKCGNPECGEIFYKSKENILKSNGVEVKAEVV